MSRSGQVQVGFWSGAKPWPLICRFMCHGASVAGEPVGVVVGRLLDSHGRRGQCKPSMSDAHKR